MGIFAFHVKASGGPGSGGHGCDRRAAPGERLAARCKQLSCADCLAWDFVQNLRQKGFIIIESSFVNNAGAVSGEIVDDLVNNKRESGQF